MSDDKIINQAVLKVAKNGRLSCSAARKLSENLKVSQKEIGDACNDLKIKIHSCELGCF